MARPRFHKLPEDRQTALLTAAAMEFAAHGCEKASLNAIVAAADISKGSLYYYFDDKADLFASVLDFVERMMLEAFAPDWERLTPESFWPELERLVTGKADFVRQRPWLMGIARAMYETDHPDVADWPRARSGWLEQLIERGQALGAVRSDIPAELVVRLTLGAGRAFDLYLLEQDPATLLDDLERHSAVGLELMRRVAAPMTPDGTVIVRGPKPEKDSL